MNTDNHPIKPAHNRLTTWIISGIVAALLIFVLGFAAGRSGLSAARTELENTKSDTATRVAQAQAETEQAQTQLEAEQARGQLFGIRNWLYRSVVQLDQRNYGLAQNYLNQAAVALEQADLQRAGLTPDQVTSLKESIQGIGVKVSADTEAQQAQILQVAEQMDKLLANQNTRQTAQTH